MKTISAAFTILAAIVFFMSVSSAAGMQNGKVQDERSAAKALEGFAEETVAHYEAGRYDEALKSAERALALSKDIFGSRHTETAKSLNNLGQVHAALGNTTDAERLLLESIDITEDALGEEHIGIAPALKNLAALFASSSRPGKAEKFYLRLIRIQERSQGKEHFSLAGILESLSQVLETEERFNEAIELRERALKIREKSCGQKDSGVAAARESLAVLRDNFAASLNNRGISLIGKGELEKAEEFLLEALAIRENCLPPNDPRTISTMKNLSILYTRQQKFADAEPICLHLLAVSEDSLSADSTDLAAEYIKMARLYKKLGMPDKTAAMYEKTISALEADPQGNALSLSRQLNNLAALYIGREMYVKAAPLYSRAVTVIKESGITEEPEPSSILKNALQFFQHTGDDEKTTELKLLLGIEPEPGETTGDDKD